MPEHIRCCSCGAVVFGILSTLDPVDRDDCPNCGGTEFERIEPDD